MENMNTVLSFEELVFGALIGLTENNLPYDTISYSDICIYGRNVVEKLEQNGHRTLLLFNRTLLMQFASNNKYYFRTVAEDDEIFFIKNKNIIIDEFIMKFNTFPLEIRKELTDKEIIKNSFENKKYIIKL